jgi:hypothetical protein
MTTNIRLLNTEAKRATHTTIDTIEFSVEKSKAWKSPPFQRPLRINEKVRNLAQQIKEDGGVLPGVITIGIIGREEYLLDGQHRREAFYLSECATGYADVRKRFFDDMSEMGEEFVNLNSQLVRLRPDDIMRGLEGTIPTLTYIRSECSFVGYDQIRRNERSPILSMSALLRSWFGSGTDVPAASTTPAAIRARDMQMTDAEALVDFLKIAVKAWGRDPEYARLWSNLNLVLCMWLYRRTVLSQFSPNTTRLNKDLFGKRLLSLSTSSPYLDYLLGRHLSERDRSPAYGRIKALFAKRIEMETGKKPRLPGPAWAHHQTGTRSVQAL